MTATIHSFPGAKVGWRDRVYDLETANTRLAKQVLLAERFIQQSHEYAMRKGDALLAQMMREFLEGMDK